MIDKIIFATENKGKLKEIHEIMAPLRLPVLSLADAGIKVDIVEDGETFADNAIIKVKEIFKLGLPEAEHAIIMADDSGLCVDAMDGAPGVLSARFMGKDTSYEIKNAAIIEAVNVSGRERSARFTCVIAAILPDGRLFTSTGHMEGEIADAPHGEGGFGYDPILFLPEYGKCSAELSLEEKNKISHRGKALRQMQETLKEYIK